jgi:hypothetical protein
LDENSQYFGGSCFSRKISKDLVRSFSIIFDFFPSRESQLNTQRFSPMFVPSSLLIMSDNEVNELKRQNAELRAEVAELRAEAAEARYSRDRAQSSVSMLLTQLLQLRYDLEHQTVLRPALFPVGGAEQVDPSAPVFNFGERPPAPAAASASFTMSPGPNGNNIIRVRRSGAAEPEQGENAPSTDKSNK